MTENQTAISQKFQFSLRKQHIDCYYTGVIVNFQKQLKKPSEDSKSIEETNQKEGFPIFNQDRCFFTPGFFLPFDQSYYDSNRQYQLENFELKRINIKKEQSNSEMFVVSPTYDFCQICKKGYMRYEDHIQEKQHSKILNSSLGNKYLKELVNNSSLIEKKRGSREIKKKENKSENEICFQNIARKKGKVKKNNINRMKSIEIHSNSTTAKVVPL